MIKTMENQKDDKAENQTRMNSKADAHVHWGSLVGLTGKQLKIWTEQDQNQETYLIKTSPGAQSSQKWSQDPRSTPFLSL